MFARKPPWKLRGTDYHHVSLKGRKSSKKKKKHLATAVPIISECFAPIWFWLDLFFAPLSVRSIKRVSAWENERRRITNYLSSLVFVDIIITEEELNKQVAFAFEHDFFFLFLFLLPCTDIGYKSFPVQFRFRAGSISCDEAYLKNVRTLHLPQLL